MSKTGVSAGLDLFGDPPTEPRAPGRPPGALNKRTQRFAALLAGRGFASPAEQLADLVLVHGDDARARLRATYALARELVAESAERVEDEETGFPVVTATMTFGEALRIIVDGRKALIEYTLPKLGRLEIEADVTEKNVFVIRQGGPAAGAGSVGGPVYDLAPADVRVKVSDINALADPQEGGAE